MQTATAMLGVGCLFRLLELPADVMLSNEQLTNTDPQVVFASLVLFFLLIYSTFVSGYILKHALSCSMLIGVSWALGYVVVNIILVSLLFFR